MLDLRKGRTILPNTGVFCVPPLPTNSQKWKSGFFEGYGEGLPPYFHHHSSTNCPQTAVTTAMLIITGKWRQNHLAMGSIWLHFLSDVVSSYPSLPPDTIPDTLASLQFFKHAGLIPTSGLCTGCSLGLECSSFRYPHGSFSHFLKSPCKSHLLNEGYLDDHNAHSSSPPPALPTPFILLNFFHFFLQCL